MKYAVSSNLLLLLISLVPTPAQAELRQWMTSDGKFKVEAELISSDGKLAKLKKSDGTTVDVPLAKLSDADRKFVDSPAAKATPPEHPPADLPESVIKFKKSLESLRKLETVRLEKRIEELRKQVRLGAKDAKNPVAQEATVLLRYLGTRLKVVKSSKPYVPRLSPKDFAIGQIGELDDDLLLSTRKGEGGIAWVGVMFEELDYRKAPPIPPDRWSRTTISRPDIFYVRASFAGDLPSPARDYDRASPANRLLRSHVYEVVEAKKRGLVTDYVLAPFKMDEVSAWLLAEAKRGKK